MCWFPVDTGGKAAIRFSVNWRVEKGNLVVVLDLRVETDWWLLTVQVLQEDVNSIPIQDGESIIYVAFPEAWIPTIKKHNNRRTVQQRTTEGTATRRNNGTIGGSKCTNHSRPLWYKWYRAISRPYRLKKTSSKQSKRRDLPVKWLHRETNDNTLYYNKLISGEVISVAKCP